MLANETDFYGFVLSGNEKPLCGDHTEDGRLCSLDLCGRLLTLKLINSKGLGLLRSKVAWVLLVDT